MENNGTTTTTLSYHDDDDDKTGFYLVYVSGLAACSIDFLSSAYVLYRILQKSRRTDKPLSHALKVLAYLATADITTSLLFILNISYTVINGEVLPDKSCLAVGVLTAFVFQQSQSVIVILSVVTYFRVCLHKACNLGRHDWKLWVGSAVMSACVCAINWVNIGPTRYWCLETTGQHSLAIASFGITLGTFLICTVCYLAIMKKLKSSGKELVKTTEHAIKHAAIERNVLRRITGYVLIFFVKWLPAYICIIGFVGGHTTAPWVYMVVIISINLGGPGYAVQYVLSEGFSDDCPDSCEQSIIRQSIDNRSPSPSFIQGESARRDSAQSSIKKSNRHINVLVVPPPTYHH